MGFALRTNSLSVLLSIAFGVSSCYAQDDRPAAQQRDQRKAILDVEKQLCSAMGVADRHALNRTLADDFVFLAANQEIIPREDLLPVLPGSPTIVCLPGDSDVQVSADTAWIWSLAECSVSGITEQFQVFDLLLRRNGEWKIVRRTSVHLDPQAYLDHALDIMQRDSLRSSSIDWTSIRREAHDRAAGARTTIDTYTAIRFALDRLGDNHHSNLQLSDDLKRKEALRLSLRPDSESASKTRNDQPRPAPSFFLHRSVPEGRLIHRSGEVFAFVVVPFCYPATPDGYITYTRKLLEAVSGLAESRPRGWIVDLRGNQGGNMWPMIAGLGPLLGNNEHLGEFFNVHDHAIWFYRDGIAGDHINGIDNAYVTISPTVTDGVEGELEPRVAVNGVPPRAIGQPPVAVLIDRGTASSGEATAIAFRGRPFTRFFGEHTWGLSTVVGGNKLVDGAIMNVAGGVQADRNGKQYLEGLDPDEKVDSPTGIGVGDDDPVLKAALKWLLSGSKDKVR